MQATRSSTSSSKKTNNNNNNTKELDIVETDKNSQDEEMSLNENNNTKPFVQQVQGNSNSNNDEEQEDGATVTTINNKNLQQHQQQEQQLDGHEELIQIDRLTEVGVAAADITKLKAHGIYTVPAIHMNCRKELLNIKGLSEAKVDKIVEAAKKLSGCGFRTATQALQRRNTILKLSTGSQALNDLLGGGIESSAITEAFGEFRTGKTQIAHTLCVTCQLPLASGGGNGKAVYIDTEATFRPERIKPIAEAHGIDPEVALENILVARAFTHEHQANLISAVAAKMAEENYALIVVDSITALFRTDFSGRGELAERQQKLGKMMNQLIKLAEEFNVAVYITNQVVADPGGASMFVADPKKPVGGHILAHASTVRLSLRKGRGEDRLCKIYDSPNLAENECVFSISERGIVDSKNQP